MGRMTAEQISDREATELAMQASGGEDVPGTARSLEEMLAVGDEVAMGVPPEQAVDFGDPRADLVAVGQIRLNIAAFPLVRLPRAGRLISMIPDAFVAHAMAAALNGGKFDIDKTLEMARRIENGTRRQVDRMSQLTQATTKAINEINAAKGEPLIDTIDLGLPEGALDVEETSAESLEITLRGAAFQIEEQQATAMVDLVHLAALRRQPGLSRDVIEAELDVPSFLDVLATIYIVDSNVVTRF